MKHSIIFTGIITLALSSQLVSAGSITDTYTTGDTLTATKMDSIKAAVNDNNSKLINLFSGDGSAGDLITDGTVTDNWLTNPPANPNFNNITINAGETLTVTAGSTIRCAGTFTNNGTLVVLSGARMASIDNFAFGATPDISSTGHPGDSFRPASGGAYYTDGITTPVLVQGGMGGEGIPQATATTSFHSFKIGGGSGSGWRKSVDGSGGGLVRIFCNGTITNAGTITANGTSPFQLSGGGGGGIVILASATSVDNTTGTVNAIGGDGGVSFSFGGAGGGGGGGIVIYVAPTIVTGTVNVDAGIGGSTAVQVTNKYRYGGGAGGASGGNGGNGSDLSSAANVTPSTPGSGTTGYTIQILADPTNMMN